MNAVNPIVPILISLFYCFQCISCYFPVQFNVFIYFVGSQSFVAVCDKEKNRLKCYFYRFCCNKCNCNNSHAKILESKWNYYFFEVKIYLIDENDSNAFRLQTFPNFNLLQLIW